MSQHKQGTPYPLRMPAEMRSLLNLEANENGRSLHGEIIQRLKESLKPHHTAQQSSQ